MNKLIVVVIFAGVLIFILCAPVHAGRLSEFEKDATSANSQKSEKQARNDDVEHSNVPGFFEELLVNILLFPFRFGGYLSMMRISAQDDFLHQSNREESTNSEFGEIKRVNGESLIPFFRSDGFFHGSRSDVYSANIRLEVGYGKYGFELRHTSLHEHGDVDSLNISIGNFLYRMSYGKHFEIDLGIGFANSTGQNSRNGVSLSLPILYHYKRTYGIEYRPIWIGGDQLSLQDHLLGLHYSIQYVSIFTGYRWLTTTNASLSGPLLGLALKW